MMNDMKVIREKLGEARKRRAGYAVTAEFPYGNALADLWQEMRRMDAAVVEALAALSRLERGGWISVKDRLPEKDGQYIVAGHGYACVACYNKFNKCWDDADGDDYWRDLDYFHHWMPLPAAPKEEP